jgi:hypothetical protein
MKKINETARGIGTEVLFVSALTCIGLVLSLLA